MKATNPLAVMRLVEAYAEAKADAAHGRAQPWLVDAKREEVEVALMALGGGAEQPVALQIGPESRLVLFCPTPLPNAVREAVSQHMGRAFNGAKVVVLDGGLRLGVVSPEKPAAA